VAWLAALMLGTGGAWIGYSQAGVTDLPLSATFGAAMLLLLPWVARGETHTLPAAGAFLGLAVLAKGLVPLVLVLPAAWWLLQRERRLRAIALAGVPFVAVALPWYLLCYFRNGTTFTDEFFWRHHFSRFVSPELMHVQPCWFYLPVLAAALLPWTPLAPLAARPGFYRDPRRRLLLAWLLFGLAFFSASANKLPGYLLPLLPAAAALLALGLEETQHAAGWLAACGLLTAVFPVAAGMLPAALDTGLRRAPRPVFDWTWLIPAGLAVAVWIVARGGRRLVAAWMVAAAVGCGVLWLKATAVPRLDSVASARSLWREIQSRAGAVCVDNIDRSWRYGLNYYSVTPLPDCAREPRPWRLVQRSAAARPVMVESPR
jgi:4-amino-4-deoxy-L-arabinose transferase-like glycosyltransferase